MVMSELPEGWAETTLGEVADWGSGGTPSRSEPSFYGGTIPWIKSGELNSRYVTTTEELITEAAIRNSSAKLFPAGSVAIAMYGATIGKTAILGVDASTNQACAVGAPIKGIIEKEFLYRMLQNEKEAFIKKGKGGAQPNISQAVIKEHVVSLPSLAEQTRIIQKLNELLAQVDNLTARIDAIPTLFKRFRQSILTAAISGRLTEKWRPDCSNWRPSTIGNICTVSTGKTPKRDIDDYWKDGNIPWLTSAITGAEFCFEAEQFVTEFALKDCSLKVFEVGTLLMAMYGEGKTRGQVTELKIAATCNQACAAISVDESIAKKKFVKIRLQENYEEVRKQAVGGAQPNLNLNKVREISINLPTLDEQTEIVRRVEQLFAFADQLEAKVTSAKTRIDHLTQSILAKAFRGELVPQDPNDEPASVLLERIKAQHAAAPKAKRGRKASV
jgi:type I restriction enzyme S subunit